MLWYNEAQSSPDDIKTVKSALKSKTLASAFAKEVARMKAAQVDSEQQAMQQELMRRLG